MVARFSLLIRSLLLANLICWLSIPPSVAYAGIRMDPKPPMRWSELIGCELVVVARYEKHEAKTLSLRVVRVLKGKDVKPGDIVKTTLEHWYSIETGSTGFESFRPKAKADGIPKLCYKVQIINPGPPVPVRVLSDVRQPAVYFFPKAKTPALQRRGQVQFAVFADGWCQAVSGKDMDLTFRLMQRTNQPLARKALEELYRSRDPKTIASLIDWTIKPPVKMSLSHAVYFINNADGILISIGDRDGDVYDPLMKWLTEGGKPGDEYSNYRVGKVLARIDPGRAFDDFSKMIKAIGPGHKQIATMSLGYVQSEKAISLCIDLLDDKNLAPVAVSALRQGLSSSQHRSLLLTVWRLRALTRSRLLKALKSPRIADYHKQELRNSLKGLLAEPPDIDLAKAEKILLDPKAKVYKGWGEGKAHGLFKDIHRAADPKFVPLLVRILREVPNARKQNSYKYRKTFGMYAGLFPNAMRKELTRCGFKKEIGNTTAGNPSYAIDTLLRPIFGVPKGSTSGSAEPLLLSGDKQMYLKKLDAARRLRQMRFDNRYLLDYKYQEMLAGLWREYPKEYFKRILILLESDSYTERYFAQGVLNGLDMEFGYRAEEMKPQRDKTLQTLRPILVKVAEMSATQRRQYVLGRYGINLKGKPNKAWLPALVRAAGHYDPAVSRTALNLIDDVTDQTGALAIFSYQYYRRERIARAWLVDRGFKVE